MTKLYNVLALSSLIGVGYLIFKKVRANPSIENIIGIHHNDFMLTKEGRENNFQYQPPPEVIYGEIKSMGFNTVRLITTWDAWFDNSQRFRDRLNNVLRIANINDLNVIIDSHQWHISKYFVDNSSNARGIGFPEEIILQLVPNAPAEDWKSATEQFWLKFLDDPEVTLNNITKPIWDHYLDYMIDLVSVSNKFSNVIGTVIINEPFAGLNSIKDYDNSYYEQISSMLGSFNNYIAKNLRKQTNKIIYYTIVHPWKWKIETLNFVHLTKPNVSNTRFHVNEYGCNGYTDIEKDILLAYNEIFGNVLVTEFNNLKPWCQEPLTIDGLRNYYTFFRDNGIGNIFFRYDPSVNAYAVKAWNDKRDGYIDNIINGVKVKNMVRQVLLEVYGE